MDIKPLDFYGEVDKDLDIMLVVPLSLQAAGYLRGLTGMDSRPGDTVPLDLYEWIHFETFARETDMGYLIDVRN